MKFEDRIRQGIRLTPTALSDGPIARRITFFGAVPVMIKPPMPTAWLAAHAETSRDVEELRMRAGFRRQRE